MQPHRKTVTLSQEACSYILACTHRSLQRLSSAIGLGLCSHPLLLLQQQQQQQQHTQLYTAHVAPFQQRVLVCLGGHTLLLLHMLLRGSRRVRRNGPLQVAVVCGCGLWLWLNMWFCGCC